MRILLFAVAFFLAHLSASEASPKSLVDQLVQERPPYPYSDPGGGNHWIVERLTFCGEQNKLDDKQFMAAVFDDLLKRKQEYTTEWATLLYCDRFGIERPSNEKIMDLILTSKSQANILSLQWLIKPPIENRLLASAIKVWARQPRSAPTDFRIAAFAAKIAASETDEIDKAVDELLARKDIMPSEAESIRTQFLTPKALPNVIAEWQACRFAGASAEFESLCARYGKVAFYLARSRSIEAFKIILHGMESDDDLIKNFSLFIAQGYRTQPKPTTLQDWKKWLNDAQAKASQMPVWTPPRGTAHSGLYDSLPGNGSF